VLPTGNVVDDEKGGQDGKGRKTTNDRTAPVVSELAPAPVFSEPLSRLHARARPNFLSSFSTEGEGAEKTRLRLLLASALVHASAGW